MKNKSKYFLIYSLACIGFMSLLLSSSEIQNNEIGTYQIATMSDAGILYRLDTRTGDIVRIKKSNIPKVDLFKK
tara:strand:+ start:260 stop:481 length:222 start_codon:yes stop_codon:yes gene_type:complete